MQINWIFFHRIWSSRHRIIFNSLKFSFQHFRWKINKFSFGKLNLELLLHVILSPIRKRKSCYANDLIQNWALSFWWFLYAHSYLPWIQIILSDNLKKTLETNVFVLKPTEISRNIRSPNNSCPNTFQCPWISIEQKN